MDVYWFEQAASDVPADDRWLGAEEKARVRAFRFDKRRTDWRIGRWTAKQVVAARLGVASLDRIQILAASSGAPEVFLDRRPAPITISLSHRAGVAICAVAPAGMALGCDLEVAESRCDAFTTDYFTPAEQALIARALPVERPHILALLWSAKESVLKALRVGLRLDTRSVSVDADGALDSGNAVWRTFRSDCLGHEFNGWWQSAGDMVRTIAYGAAIPLAGHGEVNCKEVIRGWNPEIVSRFDPPVIS